MDSRTVLWGGGDGARGREEACPGRDAALSLEGMSSMSR